MSVYSGPRRIRRACASGSTTPWRRRARPAGRLERASRGSRLGRNYPYVSRGRWAAPYTNNWRVQKQQKYEQTKISSDFQTALQEFQALQRRALEKQRASVTAARAAQESEPGQASAPGAPLEQLQQQELSQLAPQDEVDFQEALIIEREDEIRNIEQGVGDLNVLFRQVAQIVGEQGEQLGSIADNVENIHDDTRQADIENRQAARYQKAARNKSCCLLLILAVILTIVLLAVLLD